MGNKVKAYDTSQLKIAKFIDASKLAGTSRVLTGCVCLKQGNLFKNTQKYAYLPIKEHTLLI